MDRTTPKHQKASSSTLYISVLNREFAKRHRSNPSYSLRSFSRFLGVPASSLALILKNKRPFPPALIKKVCSKLNFSPEERKKFEESVYNKRINLSALGALRNPPAATVLDEEGHFRIIAEWEHYAALHLLDIPGFDFAPSNIASRLGIRESRAIDVVERLLEAGLIACDEFGKTHKTHAHVKTTEDVLSNALRKSHVEALQMGIEKLESVPLEKRDFSSLTIAIDPDKIPQFKNLLREFRRKLTAFSEGGERSEIYQICLQMYPLTMESNK